MFKFPIIFVHIPKTAGTSFVIAIEKKLNNALICKDYGRDSKQTTDFLKNCSYPLQLELFKDEFRKKGALFLTGHFHAQKYLQCFEKFQFATFFRNPVTRIVSEYNHLKKHDNLEISFLEFIKTVDQIERQKQLIRGIELHELGFIGITEYYQESIELFNGTFGTNINFEKVNVASTKDYYQPSEEEINLFKQINEAEINFYDNAVNEFKLRHGKLNYQANRTSIKSDSDKKNKFKIAIGAIFRDEYDYIIEWLAWHQIAGFDNFYIADNASSDGTTVLLEALEDLGFIKLIYQPILEKHAQIVAYERIINTANIEDIEAILFIDADEFITHESMKDGAEANHLKDCFLNSAVGMVGINWRTFGSSGHEKTSSDLVLNRFNYHASDEKENPNQLLKSISRVKSITGINPHVSILVDGLIYIDSNGDEIDDFIRLEGNHFKSVRHGARRKSVCKHPLRINHYVIKSLEEFTERKNKRGNAMEGISVNRGMRFFHQHDFKECFFKFPDLKIKCLKMHIQKLNQEVTKSIFGKILHGRIAVSNEYKIRGWCVDTSDGISDSIKINIFVNGAYQGSTYCGFYRPDLLEKGISKTGMSGFHWTHAKPLNTGDIVEVKVHGNHFKFPQRAYVVIE